jgi:hypothetical protein
MSAISLGLRLLVAAFELEFTCYLFPGRIVHRCLFARQIGAARRLVCGDRVNQTVAMAAAGIHNYPISGSIKYSGKSNG